jgi:hypothetical protein
MFSVNVLVELTSLREYELIMGKKKGKKYFNQAEQISQDQFKSYKQWQRWYIVVVLTL